MIANTDQSSSIRKVLSESVEGMSLRTKRKDVSQSEKTVQGNLEDDDYHHSITGSAKENFSSDDSNYSRTMKDEKEEPEVSDGVLVHPKKEGRLLPHEQRSQEEYREKDHEHLFGGTLQYATQYKGRSAPLISR